MTTNGRRQRPARLSHWHAQVEIERRPDLYARHQAALAAVHSTTSRADPVFRAAMDELATIEPIPHVR